MRKVAIPKLEFSQWYKWENRNRYQLKICSGVYLIAISTKNLENEKPLFSDVVYIGMTKRKQGLQGRWRDFQRAINGGEGHSGGKTIFKDKGSYHVWIEKLYVSAMGIECNAIKPTSEDYIKMGWVAFLEYEAFAQFYKEVGGHPKYNTQ